jgi:peptidoglycan/xylan/chitin deacetylase (PgdA/CDA1 family)
VDPLFSDEPEAASFDRTLHWIKDWFNVLPLPEAAALLELGKLPARALCITFDDGYSDNESVALPILQRHGLTATFFVATGFIGADKPMWNDAIVEAIRNSPASMLDLRGCGLSRYSIGSLVERRNAIDALLRVVMHMLPDARRDAVARIVDAAGGMPPLRLMMSEEQIRNLHRAGMTVGAHTVTHPILARLDERAAMHEIAASKAQLEQILGERVDVFAYPSGRPGRDYTAAHPLMVRRCGFRAAVSTAWGTARHGADLFQLPRFTPWDRAPWPFAARLAINMLRAKYARV